MTRDEVVAAFTEAEAACGRHGGCENSGGGGRQDQGRHVIRYGRDERQS